MIIILYKFQRALRIFFAYKFSKYQKSEAWPGSTIPQPDISLLRRRERRCYTYFQCVSNSFQQTQRKFFLSLIYMKQTQTYASFMVETSETEIKKMF